MLDAAHLRELAISDGGFVFDPLTGHTYNVNSTALAILRALKEGVSPKDVVAQLRETFEVDGASDVARDVDDFVSRLREESLVR